MLEGSSTTDQKSKVIIIPLEKGDPLISNIGDIENVVASNPILSAYSDRKKLIEYLRADRFVNPTHNNANNIGSNNGLMSHSPFHFKITKQIAGASKDIIIHKIEEFKKDLETTEYYKELSKTCDEVLQLWENGYGGKFPIWEGMDLKEGDYIVFLPLPSTIKEFNSIFESYLLTKILKYPVKDAGICSACGNRGKVYMIPTGNNFDLSKDRKFLLRKPTRYGADLKSKSTNDYPVCERCALKIYYFFEYIKKYKFYRFVFPTTVSVDTSDYKDYSQEAIGILSMLRSIYKSNHSQPFDYVMLTTDPKLKNIDFRYVGDFEFQLEKDKKANIGDLPIYESLIGNRGILVGNSWDKIGLLKDYNLLFNNTLSKSLFETDPKKLIKSLHPFLKLKLIEYNEPVRNFLFFGDVSLFEDKIHTKIFGEMISELVENENLRNEMKVGISKIRMIMLVYYKYISLEKNGGDILNKYEKLEEKMDSIESMKIENEFEASYFMGQLFYYLLQESKAENRLKLFTNYTLNVNDMEGLKQRLLDVLEKYSHNEYLEHNRRFHNIMKEVLAFDFNSPYRDNKIAIYTGYFDKNLFYGKDEENGGDEE